MQSLMSMTRKRDIYNEWNILLEYLKASAKPTTGTVDRRSHMMPCTLTQPCLSPVDLSRANFRSRTTGEKCL
uniref:Putative ovule protein n=1 Tax=Solanum chacoense TaxID=4108 RepID=A0A0V0HGR3_SOLCH